MLKRIAGCLVIALLLGGLCVVVFSAMPPPEQSFLRPDGSVVRLAEVSYGSNHTVVWGKPFQRSLYKILPGKLKTLSRIRIYGFTTNPLQTNVPVFCMFDSRPQTNAPPVPGRPPNNYLPVRVVDAYGCEYEPSSYSMGMTYLGLEGSMSYYQVNPSDPHGKVVGLCVYDSSSKTQRLGRFLIPGTALVPLPAVKQPLAPLRQDGEFSFQLTSLVTGLKSEPFAFSKMTNGVLFSQATFRIAKNGATALNWFPAGLKIIDGKGKRVAFRAFGRGFKEGDAVFNFESVLNPAKGPFKLRAEFRHEDGFASEELVTFKDVPFPAGGQSLTPHMKMESQGQRVILDVIYSSTAEKPADFYQPGQPFIQARIEPTTNSFNLQLARVIDDKGAEIYPWGMSVVDKGVYRFNIDPKAKPKSMTLTFALHQSRFAEFEVMPVVVSTNRLAKN